MSPEAQRIAIAETCGWTNISIMETGWLAGNHKQVGNGREVPDYLNDLNAMHEAEGYFDDKPVDLRSLWVDNLAVCAEWPKSKNALELKFEVSYVMQRLSAAQRAKAFLRTLSK